MNDKPRPPKLSAAELAKRAPPPPEYFGNALQDRIHKDTGRVRAAKSVHFANIGKMVQLQRGAARKDVR